MKTKSFVSLFAAAVLSIASASALADPGGEGNNTGCNGVGNVNSPCQGGTPGNGGSGGNGGNGGTGGTGGAGGAGGNAGNSTNTNTNNNTNTVTGTVTGTNTNTNTVNGVNTQSQGQHQGQSQAATSNASSGGNVMSGGNVEVNTNIRPAASAPATPLTSVGTDNCLGSVGGSFGNGFISIGGGTTKESDECNRRANSRRLEALGFRGAAVALQCMNDEVRSAMKIAGTPCPQDQQAKSAMAPSAPQASVAGYRNRDAKITAARAAQEAGLPNMGIEVNVNVGSEMLPQNRTF